MKYRAYIPAVAIVLTLAMTSQNASAVTAEGTRFGHVDAIVAGDGLLRDCPGAVVERPAGHQAGNVCGPGDIRRSQDSLQGKSI